MVRKYILWILVITMGFTMGGCLNREEQNNGENELEQPKQEEPSDPKDNEPVVEVDPIKDQIEKMTLNQKIGQIVVMGLEGYTIDDSTKEIIKDYQVGGFILFGRNISNSAQLLQLTNSLKESNSMSQIPLFISVDEEGGKVTRVPDEFIKIPSNRTIGKKNDKEISYQIGSVIGETVKALGFNMNFAPVLDIDSNPSKFN